MLNHVTMVNAFAACAIFGIEMSAWITKVIVECVDLDVKLTVAISISH